MSNEQQGKWMSWKKAPNSFMINFTCTHQMRVATVDIETWFGLDYLGVRHQVLTRPRIFLSPHCPNQLWGAIQHPINWICGGELSPGVKLLEREADQSPPTSAEVKITWIYTFTPTYTFIAYCLISWALGQITFIFYSYVKCVIQSWDLLYQSYSLIEIIRCSKQNYGNTQNMKLYFL
jgi:hypothetical protein